jgi:hypothetical protein
LGERDGSESRRCLGGNRRAASVAMTHLSLPTLTRGSPSLSPRVRRGRRGHHLVRLVCPSSNKTCAAASRGEVLFDRASRGRYSTDASIYPDRAGGRRDPARRGRSCRAAAARSQCGQTVGAGLVIDCSKHVRNLLGVDVAKRTVEVEPGIVLDHLNAALKPTACGTRWTCPPARRHAGRHGRQQLLRQPLDRLRQHGAQRAGRQGLDWRWHPD